MANASLFYQVVNEGRADGRTDGRKGERKKEG
jgi:hypothetical protein